jgi:hypothetical protein
MVCNCRGDLLVIIGRIRWIIIGGERPEIMPLFTEKTSDLKEN